MWNKVFKSVGKFLFLTSQHINFFLPLKPVFCFVLFCYYYLFLLIITFSSVAWAARMSRRIEMGTIWNQRTWGVSGRSRETGAQRRGLGQRNGIVSGVTPVRVLKGAWKIRVALRVNSGRTWRSHVLGEPGVSGGSGGRTEFQYARHGQAMGVKCSKE